MKNILILCGMSSSGKDSILRKLVSDYDYLPIISVTSRPMRIGEKDGVDYLFETKENFLKLIKNDRLIEYRTYNTLVNGVSDVWYYGLIKHILDDNKKYVVILDIKGTKDFISYYGKDKCEVIYVDCPSEIRKERAMKRGSFDLTEWNRRSEADEIDFSEDKRIGVVDRVVQNWGISLDDVVKEIVEKGGLE
jgi:guanylate kinase